MLGGQTTTYQQEMEHLEHYHDHVMDTDKNSIGYEGKTLTHEEHYPPLHSTTWMDRHSFRARMSWDGAESNRAAEECTTIVNPEPKTLESSMLSTH